MGSCDQRSETHPVGLSIVIPVFNEVENIRALVAEAITVCELNGYGFEIIVVDDGSTDGSGEAVSGLAQVKVIHFRRNFGQTAAFDAGIRAAKRDLSSSPWMATARMIPLTFPDWSTVY